MDSEEKYLCEFLIKTIENYYNGQVSREKLEEITSELFSNLVYYKTKIQQ